jgi:hypothetical protein
MYIPFVSVASDDLVFWTTSTSDGLQRQIAWSSECFIRTWNFSFWWSSDAFQSFLAWLLYFLFIVIFLDFNL